MPPAIEPFQYKDAVPFCQGRKKLGDFAPEWRAGRLPRCKASAYIAAKRTEA